MGARAPLAHDPWLRRREKSILLSSNRKLERKVKELTIQVDDERQHVSDQKDQVGGSPRRWRAASGPAEGTHGSLPCASRPNPLGIAPCPHSSACG